ncbi:fasciclin domain-containing protein [Plantactinospora soyae]|uniref:Surface protein with fasciclin (FAS1) repeats n=1 Tax=Plantactinospora soyae TaxID=1544732 RepID=A0A927MDC7_9ACTN|nr:fasciclin domain-containing protein [Plantactinospora soyae]MBE1489653.1 putative surface protein with fasciclin (FAS1) repeats [Plantactinospora soyae]
MRTRILASLAVATVCTLALGACAGDSADEAGGAPATSSPPMATTGPAMMDGEFGPGCAAVPTDTADPGSFAAMAKVPVATAASGNPMLSTLVSAVKQADLVDSLNSADGVTVFAPTNDAFAKIPKADLDKVLADKKMLSGVLTYHVVPGKLAPGQLAGPHKTLQGGMVTVTGSGTDFKVGPAATVVCGNVQTANAVVYLVDSVLMPPS